MSLFVTPNDPMSCVENGFTIVTKYNLKGVIIHLYKKSGMILIKNENGKHEVPISDVMAIL